MDAVEFPPVKDVDVNWLWAAPQLTNRWSSKNGVRLLLHFSIILYLPSQFKVKQSSLFQVKRRSKYEFLHLRHFYGKKQIPRFEPTTSLLWQCRRKSNPWLGHWLVSTLTVLHYGKIWYSESITTYLSKTNVQLGASYAIGQRSTALYNGGYAAAAKYINTSEDNIGENKPPFSIRTIINNLVLGSSTTQLFRNLSWALSYPVGSEIIISKIDHEVSSLTKKI